MPFTAETLSGLEALTTGITFVWFGDAADTVALAADLQTSDGIARWASCAHYVRSYRDGQTPVPDALSAVQQTEAEELECTLGDALEVFRGLVASYDARLTDEIGLFYAYLMSDPACWDDWLESARGIVGKQRGDA